MFSSLRFRLWLSYALLIVTALGVVAMIVFVYLLRNPLLYRQTIERLRAAQRVVMERNNDQPLSVAAEQTSRAFNVRLVQYSADRQILFDSYAGKAPVLSFPEKRIALRNLPLLRDGSGTTWLYSIEILPDNTYLVAASPRPRISIGAIFKNDFLPLIFWGGLIALVLSLFVAFIFSGWIADPLQRVVLAARRMPLAEAKPVVMGGPHEVQELTRAFNSMVTRVQNSQRSQREFVANISHELKTPLTSIQGFAQAILDGTADTPDDRKQAAQVIYNESARMHRMVLDLLDLARLDAGTADISMMSVNIPALLNAVAEKFMPQSQKAGVEISVDSAVDLPLVFADGDRLSQVFTNLVDNALKFTSRGGAIKLHASVINGEMLVSVADTGIGIPIEAQAHIFDRFYQADSARKGGEKHGAGLGLAIVREIIQAHGGRISVRSRLGEGTTIEVFLPLNQNSKTTVARKK